MSSNRPEKIADLLKREVSKILNQEVKDPRLQNINITAVRVTDDIGIAYIFYTIIGKSIKKDESKIDNTILSKLSGMIRSKLSKIVEIRRVPKIIFKFDESIEYSENIEKLLKTIKEFVLKGEILPVKYYQKTLSMI